MSTSNPIHIHIYTCDKQTERHKSDMEMNTKKRKCGSQATLTVPIIVAPHDVIEENDRAIKLQRSDNAGKGDLGDVIHFGPSPKRVAWDDHAVFLTEAEIVDTMLKAVKGSSATLEMSTIAINFAAERSIMPYMVDTTDKGVRVLNKELLFDLFDNKTYKKLDNFLQFRCPTKAEGTAELMHTGEYDTCTSDVATAILVTCGHCWIYAYARSRCKQRRSLLCKQ
jgi:hypothetical protein